MSSSSSSLQPLRRNEGTGRATSLLYPKAERERKRLSQQWRIAGQVLLGTRWHRCNPSEFDIFRRTTRILSQHGRVVVVERFCDGPRVWTNGLTNLLLPPTRRPPKVSFRGAKAKAPRAPSKLIRYNGHLGFTAYQSLDAPH